MIHSRITAKAQTTVPLAIRRALGVEVGDEVAWELDGDRVVLRRVTSNEPDLPISDFSTFTEWSDELDAVFDDL